MSKALGTGYGTWVILNTLFIISMLSEVPLLEIYYAKPLQNYYPIVKFKKISFEEKS